jgi:predicted phage terminase large subunit-like protein
MRRTSDKRRREMLGFGVNGWMTEGNIINAVKTSREDSGKQASQFFAEAVEGGCDGSRIFHGPRAGVTLSKFAVLAWEQLEPSVDRQWNWHHDLICEYLELIDRGEIKKIVFNVPPRHLKSLLITVIFPCWQWLRRSHLKHLCLSYSASLANDHSDLRRSLIKSSWYRSICPNLKLSNTKDRISEFANNSGGVMASRGLEGTVTGIGGNVIIFDDPNNPEKVESEVIRKGTSKKFKDYSIGRKNDPKNTVVIVVQQRTHVDDVTGIIEAENLGYQLVSLPTVAEKYEEIIFPISGKKIVREIGDLLHDDRFGSSEVTEAKTTLGEYLFAGRHQQSPFPVGGGMFKEEWWQYFTEPPKLEKIVWAWDTAFKIKTHNDYSCGICIGSSNKGYYLLDVVCDRLEYPDLKRRVVAAYNKYKSRAILVEDKASGQSLIQDLKRDTLLPIVAVGVDRDKISRAVAITATIESGKVYLPNNAPWLADFLAEFSAFPNGAHDDRIDALTLGLNYLIPSGKSWWDRSS